MFKSPKIATEITLQPLQRFNLDGAILYADILLIPDALDLNSVLLKKKDLNLLKQFSSETDLKIF